MNRVLIGLGMACALVTGLAVLAAAPQSSTPPAAKAASPPPRPNPATPAPPAAPGAPAAAAAPAAPKPEDEAKIFYAVGFVLGGQTGVFALTPAEAEEVRKGFADALAGKEAQVAMETFGPQIR